MSDLNVAVCVISLCFRYNVCRQLICRVLIIVDYLTSELQTAHILAVKKPQELRTVTAETEPVSVSSHQNF